jgi:hypothetical protein
MGAKKQLSPVQERTFFFENVLDDSSSEKIKPVVLE